MSRNNLEDIYPLAPMQQGILFQTLLASEASEASEPGAYFVQTGWTLRGDVDTAALVRAFQEVTARHGALRTAFVWEKLEQPMQVVWKRVKLPVTEVDLRGLSPAEQTAKVAAFAAEDRRRGFDLTRAPLMRLAFLRLDDDAYRFIWSAHHLILDGWSNPILLAEVFGLYEAAVSGRELRLDRARPYGEYVAWLQKQDPKKTEEFWRARLAGITAPTPLPPGDAEPSAEAPYGDRTREISAPALAAMQDLVRTHGLTLSTLLQGAWALLLARYSGEDEVLFGATVSGRSAPVPGIDRMVGMFINTVAVRVAVPREENVLAWLKGLHRAQGELSEHEHTSLVDAQGWSAIPRGTPLFESLVVYENYPVDPMASPQPAAAPGVAPRKRLAFSDAASSETPPYPLTLIGALRKTLTLRLGFDARRFAPATVDRLLGHLVVLLARLVDGLDGRVGDLSPIDAGERNALIEGRNETTTAYPREASLVALFEAEADAHADAIALVFGEQTLTYRELDRRANQLAHTLRERGVGEGTPVGILAVRSIEMIVGTLGILKAGGAYVPLDPDYPAARLAFLLDDAAVKIIIGAGEFPPSVVDRELVRLDVDAELLACADDARLPDVGRGAASLAYVMYTSGSTGRPKGVAVPDRAVVRLVKNTSYARFADDEVFFQLAPLAFDASTLEIWGPLLNGGRLVIAPAAMPSLREIGALIRAHGVTTLWLTTGLFNAMVEHHVEGLATLRRVLTGGDTLSVPHVRAALEALPGVAIINGYGPTEGTTFTTCHAVVHTDTMGAIPIGRPIANTRVYLLDEHLGLVPTGAFGELYVGGDGLARGYLGLPELTAERFVASPFAEDERLYKTGDLARWMPDGALAFGGRRDFQVKIRGYRIELGEIESALGANPDVASCTVIAREDTPGDKRLVAYVVGRDGVAPAGADLARYLAERLPAHMVPAAFVALAAIPITANGKIDRRALPAPDAAGRGDREYVAPRGPVEETLAAIFAEVLKVASVGAHDGFFELGGHSLLATQAVTRIRGAFGVELPLRALFESPTPEGLAALVSGSLRGSALPPLVAVPRDQKLRLSFAQERLWLVDQIDPGNPAYNVPEPMRLVGPLDVVAFERALRELVRRHEVLRTTIATSGGRPVQIVHDEVAFWGGLLDLSALPEAEREPKARAEAAADARLPFDLARGPLLRARLIRLDPEQHLLLLTMHHIVSDAWTRGIVSREVRALYEAFRAGEPSPLPDLTVQYADFAEWQRGWLSGDVLTAQLAYWKQKLEGAPLALELPTDRPRPPVQTFRGALRGMALSTEATKALHDLSRKEGLTLYMTLLTALDLLLYRTTGQPDVVVGTSIAGRTQAETEKLVGFFINALVLRTTVDEDATLRALLQQVRETCLGAYAHQDMPFERLVHELSPEQDRSRAPLFQVIFTMQNAPRAGLALPGLSIRGLGGSGSTTAKYDLTFLMADVEGSLRCSIEYNTDLFDPATIDRMLRQLNTLLVAMPKALEKKVRELSIVPEAERARLLASGSAAALAGPEGACLHELFEAQVDASPDAPALVAGSARFTFAELDRRANQLAHHLRGLGVGPESVIGLCLGRGADVIIALLGILKSGGAYLPLEPTYPAGRIAQILGEAGATIVVTQASLAAAMPAGVKVISVDADAAKLAAGSADRLETEVMSSNLAYVLFTSGSTGKPKGVAVEHRQLVNYTLGVGARLALPAGASYAHVSTFAADLGNTVLFPPLVTGGVLHVISEELTTDPEGLGAYFAREKIDCLKIVPSHLSALLTSAHPSRVLPRALLVLGGEASSWELVDRLQRLAPAMRILNHYGPTETTVGVLTHAVPSDRSERAPTAIVPLGTPLPGSRVHVLDARRDLAPTGVPGEVYIGGAQVARGYLNQPELTAERFVPDPFTPGARLYRTGDRARTLPDGTLVFLGRIDFQVKIRGFRIELGEIESTLATHPGLKDAVVLALDDGDTKRLAAFVVQAAGAEPTTAADLAAFVAQRLPEYMIPASVDFLDALPLSSNGKIDRRALATIERPKEIAGDFAEPRTPTEEVLASIWADVFTRERVGIDERFSDLGGHSLLAIQIIARARDAFQAQIPLRAMFEHPTIAALAAIVDATVREDHGLEAPPITRMPRGAELRLSFAQERLWFLDQLEPGTSFYNVPSATRFGGPFSTDAMSRAFQEIVRRHEVLRTTFAVQDGQPIQVIDEGAAAPLAVVDLGPLAPAAREEAARFAVRDEAARPFDLAVGPMVRGQILRLGDEEHVLLLTMHHIVSDASTRGIFQRELMALYAAFTRGQPSPLAELPIQYADYAHWQRRWLDGEILEKQLAYWKTHLDGAPTALVLPTDRGRPPVQTHHGDRRTASLPAATLAALKELSRREGMTLFMTLLAATYTLLHRYSGQEDILVGSPVLNRSRRETEGLIGFFVNTLVLRAQPTGDLVFRDLLQQVREACLGGYAHQDIPFERLVQELAPDRDLSRSPLFQVMFTLETFTGDGGSGGGGGLKMRAVNAPTTTAKFDLMIGMAETPNGLGIGLEYNTDLFDGATIDRMLQHLRRVIEAVAADADQKLRDVPLLSDEERSRLLVTWNDTRTDYPREASVHALFEATVDARPEALALVFGDERITYRELDRRSNQVAHHLRRRGVREETPVGVLAERSIEMIVAVLGILKAGGAYVPLDADYPAARLAFLIEDSGVKLIVGAGRFPAAMEAHALVRLDVDREVIAAESDARLGDVAASGSSLAYIMYTSGSTGTPKGVCAPHRAVVRLVRNTGYAPFGDDETFLQFAPLAFDASTFEIWGPLLNGGRLVIYAPGIAALSDLGDVIRSQGVTTLWLTTGLFNAMVEENVQGLASLRRILTGGDSLSVAHVQTAIDALPNVELINGYGPTEGTTFTTCHAIPHARATGAISIGRPIANTRVYILDPHLAPAPIGVFGELYVGGDGVARGYLNRPELTAERFIASPFVEGDRLYKTGDLARWMPDGTIAFGGRRDFQVKIRGFRIELGEIEVALGAHPAMRECTVIVREDSPGEKRLVAYVVPTSPEAAPAPTELRAFLKESLPDYMIPTVFVTLAALPLTANGKVDRAALPAPTEGGAAPGSTTVAPRDELEAQIVTIWRRVLNISRVGITDSFFDLGGHSMLAVRMASELKKVLGRTIPLMSLFEAQTIEQIADLLREGPAKHQWKTLVPIKPTGSRRPFFLVTRPNANSLGYIALAKRFDPDQPMYGLQFQYPEEAYLGRPYSREEYEDRGRSYVEILRAFQPEGPYLLGGMCEGALIAFVMTRQLEAAGQRVAFLGMMDAWPEENTRSRTLNWLFAYDRQLRDFMRQQRKKKQSLLRQALDRVVGRVRSKLWGAEPSKVRAEVQRAAAFDATTRALWDERVFPGPSFVPPRVNAPITVLRVKDQPYWRIKDERLGWSDRTNATVDLHYLDGQHADFMRAPHVDVLARELGIALRKVHARLDREHAIAAAQPSKSADSPQETADRPAP
jgi:amino acid adenylation domain-containing protein